MTTSEIYEVVYKSYVTFSVLGKEVNLYTEQLDYGFNTVAELDDRFHYLGNEISNIASAIFTWQEVNGRDLTNEELRQVMYENNLLSAAI